jgi:hypothetical protein
LNGFLLQVSGGPVESGAAVLAAEQASFPKIYALVAAADNIAYTVCNTTNQTSVGVHHMLKMALCKPGHFGQWQAVAQG